MRNKASISVIEGKLDNKINKKIYVKFYVTKVLKTQNIYDMVEDLFHLENILSKKDDLITVKTFGGEIIFKRIKDAILMKGPATFIYKGNINE